MGITINFKSRNLNEGDYLGHIGINHNIKIKQSYEIGFGGLYWIPMAQN